MDRHVVGWARVEGCVRKHCFCLITWLPSQQERFFVKFEPLDATKRIFSCFSSVWGVGWSGGATTFLDACIHVAMLDVWGGCGGVRVMTFLCYALNFSSSL